MEYDHKKIEEKWQKIWEDENYYHAEDPSTSLRTGKPKFYALIEFPYPSGDGLHVGHIRSNTAMDIIARKRRAEGFNVLYPIGWDAFGLPTENYALKTGIHPSIITKENTDKFRRQLKSLGFSFDWSREINTTDPKYYKWTQWIFLQLYKHNLAYKAKAFINWCPKDKIGLANEEVIDGKCERCGTAVEKKEKEQWILAITKYADRLDKDLDTVDFLSQIKVQQRNWIKNLHDWIFSRQRYWGEPIPLINCPKCGIVAVAEEDLPVELPQVENYQPTDTGESPLAAITDWVNVKCPTCDGEAKRETDTMPNWAGSSWYFLRYIDPHNDKVLASPEKLKYWMGVDWYNGGTEHITLHLLYSRFWNKFLFDIGVVPTSEPYKKRTLHGFILAPDGEKMSKSRGNIINPDEVIETFGADTLRLYEMFMGPFDQAVSWSTEGILGPRRFLEKVWRLQERVTEAESHKPLRSLIHQTIKKVSDDIEGMRFNTAVSSMMILVNAWEKEKAINKDDYQNFLLLLQPFCPHISAEIWQNLEPKTNIETESWPTFLDTLIVKEEINIVVQINGKVRSSIKTPLNLSENDVLEMAKSDPTVNKWLAGKEIKKVIFIKDRLINLVLEAQSP